MYIHTHIPIINMRKTFHRMVCSCCTLVCFECRVGDHVMNCDFMLPSLYIQESEEGLKSMMIDLDYFSIPDPRRYAKQHLVIIGISHHGSLAK